MMRHKTCNYCKKIGHIPEMDLYVDIGYIEYPIDYIRRYGLHWYHTSCHEKMIQEHYDRVKEIKGE